MPIPRYSSSSTLSHGRDGTGRGGEGDGTMHPSNRNSGLYRSSPDLSRSAQLNRRSSSTDSNDGSYYGGGHSRQSSDSVDYPTRRYSAQHPARKTSVSADPLQFIKVKGATNLALTAEEQMKLAAETKRIKPSPSFDDDNTDWRSNLNMWKSRRKSQSEKSYQLKEELEQMEREKEEHQNTSSISTKTFSQMKEDGDRRKSASSRHFYPIDDEGEDDIFTPVKTEHQQSSPVPKTTSRFQSPVTGKEETKAPKVSSKTKDKVADWAKDAASESEEEAEEEEEEEREEDKKNNSKASPKPVNQASRLSRDSETESTATRQRRSGLPDRLTSDSRGSWQKSRLDTGREGASKENNRNSANNSSLSAPESSSKFRNIWRTFEQKEEDKAKPKSRVDSSVDISARKMSFEKFSAGSNGGDHREEPSLPSLRRSAQPTSSSSVYASQKNSGKDYMEKTIKISQKANSDKGFGFTLGGGADKKQPVVVEKVGLGSAADVCELQTKDEVVAINGRSVTGLTSAELNQKVKDAVRVGQIELRVKRFLGAGDEFEEDEEFSSTDEELGTPERSISKSSSVRAENSFDSLDSRDDHQKTEGEPPERQWIEEHNSSPSITTQSTRRGGPTSTSSDSGYDAQTFSPWHRGDISSNEEEIAPPSSQPETEVQKRPSLAARTRHLYRDEDEENYVNLQDTNKSPSDPDGDSTEQGREREVIPTQQIQVESRPSITVRREIVNVLQKGAEEDDSKPLATFEAQYKVSSNRQGAGGEKFGAEKNGDDSDAGPPAALRKWQRQRPRDEYTFESDDPDKFYQKLNLSSSFPRQSEKPNEDTAQEDPAQSRATEGYDESMHSQHPLVSSRHTFNLRDDRRRLQQWNQQQEEERQSTDQLPSDSSENLVEVTIPFDQRRFTAEREQLQQQYQDDLQRAADTGRWKQDQEQQMLEPEREKTRLLEERRAQRQARIQQYAQDTSNDITAPSAYTRSAAPAVSEQPGGESEAGQLHTSTFTTQIQGGRGSGGPPEVLIIDPRNRGGDAGPVREDGQAGQGYQFQVKINSRDTPQGLLIQPEVIPTQYSTPPPPDHAAFLEAERERIRQEELQKLKAEQQRIEDEERRQIRNKEEQLRQKAELLRQQEEELRKTKEQFERERQQLQQMAAAPPTRSQQPDNTSSPNTSHDSLQFETVTSKVRGGSPAYTSTVVTGPRRSDGRPQASGSYSDRNRIAGSHSDRGRDGYGVRRSEPSWNSSGPQNSTSWRGSAQPVASSQSSLPKWPPAEGDRGRGAASSLSHGAGPGQYSREDMMAMNRKATPLQSKPPSSPTSPPAEHPEVSSPIRREAPSKGQLRSLNSVPKARIRNPDQWIADDPQNNSQHSMEGRPQPAASRRSEASAFRSQFAGPQDHWLVQEAERRRVQHSGQGPSRSEFSGPIKPATDNYGNPWREDGQDVRLSPNMPAQIRQTLLEKTAGARGSTGSNYSQEFNPQASSPSYQSGPFSSLSQTLPPGFAYRSGYSSSPRSDAMPPQHRAPSPEDQRENGVSVSGKQRCSHCDQELGFGAAMVIESLGLFYHTQCFKCCVCRTPLGSGVEGADVRVRVNKLHCPNCYSNDEAGLKFSKV